MTKVKAESRMSSTKTLHCAVVVLEPNTVVDMCLNNKCKVI